MVEINANFLCFPTKTTWEALKYEEENIHTNLIRRKNTFTCPYTRICSRGNNPAEKGIALEEKSQSENCVFDGEANIRTAIFFSKHHLE